MSIAIGRSVRSAPTGSGRERSGDDIFVVSLAGEHDLYTAPQVQEALRSAIAAGARTTVVDLTETTFLDSTMLHVLLTARNELRDGGRLLLVTDDATVKRVFEITGIDRLFDFYPSRRAAEQEARSDMTTTSEQVRDHASRTRRAGADRPTLCFFYSPTSGPSRRVEAFLAHVLQRRQKHRTFAVQRVNCDEHPELVERYAVKQMPTLIVIENRRVLGRLEGRCGCREIEKLLEPWLDREAERGRVENGTGPSPHAVAAISTKANEGLEEGLVHPARNGSARTPYTPVGLRLPASLSFERWQALGRRIGSITNASSWWLGDWALYGEGSYGEKYKQAIAVTGLDYQTLRNYAWVAGRFDLSRRRDKLSFGHHAELAALPEHEQDDMARPGRKQPLVAQRAPNSPETARSRPGFPATSSICG